MTTSEPKRFQGPVNRCTFTHLRLSSSMNATLRVAIAGALALGVSAADVGVGAIAEKARDLREYRERAANQEGDTTRGKELFFDDSRCACARCHSVAGSASKAGPDLFTAGDKFPRRDLIRAILEPSESIAVGYGTTTITTKTGEEYSGVIKQVTDQWTELMLGDGSRVRINRSDIKEQSGSNVSLMPAGLESGL